MAAHDRTLPDSTTCVIAGCGPAGAMLGLLLARAGVDVVVLEKHPDFFRDFRGDTVHASTLQILDDLDLTEAFARVPQQRTTRINLMTDDGMTAMGDFTELPGRFRYLSMVPQWDFLSFLTAEAARYPGFSLHREVEVTGLVEDGDGVVRGLRCRTAAGEEEIRADLVVAADGRSSATRAAAGLVTTEYGSPLDVLWYRVSRAAGDPSGTLLRIAPGGLFPMIDRRHVLARGPHRPEGRVRAAARPRHRGVPGDPAHLPAVPGRPRRGGRLGRRRLPRGPGQPPRLLVAARPAVHRRRGARDVARRRRGDQPGGPGRRRRGEHPRRSRCSTGGCVPPTCARCSAGGSCRPG